MYDLTTLLFVCGTQYEVTAPAVYEVADSIETLVELLQIYREKGVIFTSLCMLLGIMGLDPRCREVIYHLNLLIEVCCVSHVFAYVAILVSLSFWFLVVVFF